MSNQDKYLIWSGEHNAWWRPRSAGYTSWRDEAGRYGLKEAALIVGGVGPEKKLEIVPDHEPTDDEIIQNIVDEYEFCGEDDSGREGRYDPNDFERMMLRDFAQFLLSELPQRSEGRKG